MNAIRLLQQYLGWVSYDVVLLKHNVIPTMVTKFLNNDVSRTDVIICMTKVYQLKDLSAEVRSDLLGMFGFIMDQVATYLPPDMTPPLSEIYPRLSYTEQNFIQRFSLFITKFLTKQHIEIMEQRDQEHLLLALKYLICISAIGTEKEMQLFKICLDFWRSLSSDVFMRHCSEIEAIKFSAGGGFVGMGGYNNMGVSSKAKTLYGECLQKVCAIMITNMAKPEEVLIEEDENGEIVRAATANTDELVLYKMMKESLVFLTKLDSQNIERLMQNILTSQVEDKFEWHSLNTLCWAIGSISGAMAGEEEKRFLVSVIKDLLHLCEMKTGKQNKAVVASNIMYVVGQYPSFLNQHWKFLKTVVNKVRNSNLYRILFESQLNIIRYVYFSEISFNRF